MEKKFKTNINCGGCVANVSESLNELLGKDNWEVNTAVSEKVLTIRNEAIIEEDIIALVKQLGYKIERLTETIT
jgi:copper chaperone CopZ